MLWPHPPAATPKGAAKVIHPAAPPPAASVVQLPTGCGCTSEAMEYSPLQISAQEPVKVTKPFSGGNITMGGIAGSCWMSLDEMILWNGHQLVRYNRAAGPDVPIPGTEDAFSGKHWVSIVALSPDGRWLVWAGGVDGHSTWVATSIDGTERREWPRAESITTPAIAWMQDSQHWVELSTPETKISAGRWEGHPDNMRARVYSLDAEDIQDFSLRLEIPDPGFILPTNCDRTTEFLFTSDGHAWLSKNRQTCSSGAATAPYSREDVYQILPGPTVWTLHKCSIYPKADPMHWMFDSPTRSPDGNWIVWRNYIPNGKDDWRLMLSRPDGSDMREIYQGDTSSGGQVEWSPDSRQIAFTDNGPLGLVTMKLEVAAAARLLTKGPFSTAAPRTLLARRR